MNENGNSNTEQQKLDRRPPPKPRKHPGLWQWYLIWKEMTKLQNGHLERQRSVNRGKCNYDSGIEQTILDLLKVPSPTKRSPDRVITMAEFARLEMCKAGAEVGPIWDWLLDIRGIAESSAAKILAQIDDIGKFATRSKLRRYAGWGTYEYWVDTNGKRQAPQAGKMAVTCKPGLIFDCRACIVEMERKGKRYICPSCGWYVQDGKDNVILFTVPEPKDGWTLERGIDRGIEGWILPFNKTLKSEVWVIVDNFIKQRTPVYREFYDNAKQYERIKHPVKEKTNGKTQFNDGHINNRAIRKTAQLFLSHLWEVWRKFEGLPVPEPYVQAILGHVNIIEPQSV